MRVLCVDPGETIGLAWYDSDTKTFDINQVPHTDIDRALRWCERWLFDVELVENYQSSGALSKEGKNTIMVLGVFHLGYGFELVPPQARLSSVAKATELVGEDAKEFHRNARDGIAALAHCISYARDHA